MFLPLNSYSYYGEDYALFTDKPVNKVISLYEVRYIFHTIYESYHGLTTIYLLPYGYKEQNMFIINYLGLSPSRFKEITSTDNRYIKVTSRIDMRNKLLHCNKCIGINKLYIMKYDIESNKIIKIKIAE